MQKPTPGNDNTFHFSETKSRLVSIGPYQQVCERCQLSKAGTETYEMTKTAFGDEAMSRARVFEWFRPFKEGRQSVNSGPRSGRPSTSRNEDKIAQVKAVVRSDCRLTV
ncbi:hypothetical protein TNCV_3625591 [Trichonephila clavipes]|nr:hypothetical protein TNCV_3625591 [Trichonephila clavipes]